MEEQIQKRMAARGLSVSVKRKGTPMHLQARHSLEATVQNPSSKPETKLAALDELDKRDAEAEAIAELEADEAANLEAEANLG